MTAPTPRCDHLARELARPTSGPFMGAGNDSHKIIDWIALAQALERELAAARISISDGSTWISVKDRVPMGEGQVLAVNSVGFMACVTTIYKNTDGKYDGEDATPEETTEPIGDITHWMPLPEAPK